MARKQKSPVATPELEIVEEVMAVETPEVVEEAVVVGNPWEQLTATPATPETPASTAHAVMLAKALSNGNAATFGGVAGVLAAPNVAARGTALNNVPANMAPQNYTLGRPCKVRVPYTIASYNGVVELLAEKGGYATGAEIAAASTGDFLRYAVKSGWLLEC